VNLAVLGAGAWGTALATSFAPHHAVALWARDADQRAALAHDRRSRYLPEITLPASIAIADDLDAALARAEVALVVTPTAGLREAVQRVHRAAPALPIVWACKGFEQGSALLPHQVVAAEIGNAVPSGALSGPSFALEVARGQPTALTLAAENETFARDLARALHHRRRRVYFSTDVVGVEVGGAVKNVMAIATGIAEGLGLGLNARAALVTRGLAELTRLGVAMGGRIETFIGLAGAGDLILTCTGDLSRNRRVGLLLAEGRSLDAALGALGHVAEGVYTAASVARVAAERGVDMPITRAVCAVFEGVAAASAVERLLDRDPKAEDA
jgi:glycerol-3-phosphate dehydrogenase (NAD(P)+)